MIDMQSWRLAGARKIALEVARHLRADVSLELWNGEIIPLGPGSPADKRIIVRSPGAIRRLMLEPGLMSFFELYAARELDVSGGSLLEISRLIDHGRSRRLAKNMNRFRLLKAAVPFLAPVKSASATAGFNATVPLHPAEGRDDKALISFHYDVSNAFYQLFLDPEMVYSCGYFENPQTSLEDAQQAKLDRICQKLRLQPGDRLLDIGSGWGGLICHAAKKYGAVCHGVTLSASQFEFANAKIATLGLQDRITLELKDYRAIDPGARYDKIVQIEMFEHVGLANHDKHFEWIHQLLEIRGLYLHQASTRIAPRDLSRFQRLTPYMKFINTYIFPGGEMDHIGMTVTNLERHGFEVHDVEGMREHFQLTVEAWVNRLEANKVAAESEIGEQKTRLWLLYLSMCARAFERGGLGLFQTLATKKHAGASGLPFHRI